MTADVSVIIPVYNRAAMIGRAIASLQAQTLDNFEIIVVDDGSTDGSADVVRSIADPRVRLVAHPRNLGIPSARNSGLAEASGSYIAWLDSDDVARPERLAVQLAFLEANPSIAMIGASAGAIRPDGSRRTRPRTPPRSHEEIVATLLFRSAFQQSSIVGRADILRRYPYRLEFSVCEDIDQFIRLTREHRTANLPDVLIDRHLHAGQTVHREAPTVVEKKKILFGETLRQLGIQAADAELERHVLLGNIKKTPVDRDFLQWSEQWLERILQANREAGMYDPAALSKIVARVWKRACRATLGGPDPLYALRRILVPPTTLRAA